MHNLTIFQFFHWYYSTEGNLWQHAAEKSDHLSSLGVSHVWLPPAYKSAYGTEEPGYAVYDLYDLGEFKQKDTIRTRYGSRQEYLDCIKAFQQKGMRVIADIVLNHRLGADETKKIRARRVHFNDRREFDGGEEEKDAWIKFTFPGRKKKYSSFIWDQHSFTGFSENHEHIYLIINEYTNGRWDDMLEEEFGNYDYLMGADVEFRNPAVRKELNKWGRWYIKTTGVDALRLDAVKHITHDFFNQWIDHLRKYFKKDILCIGEYWQADPEPLLKYINATAGRMQLFDVPLHYNFHEASVSENKFDMSKILHNTLVNHKPELAITFVDNHDTQPLQALQSPVEYWFKPLAYALILLRQQGIPCVFYPALYEAKYTDKKNDEEIYVELNSVPNLEKMMKVRKFAAYGTQRDYFDHPRTIGWTREGEPEIKGSGCAVVLTNGSAGNKKMKMGEMHAGKTFADICGHCTEKVVIDNEGWGEFFTADKSVSVWIEEDLIV